MIGFKVQQKNGKVGYEHARVGTAKAYWLSKREAKLEQWTAHFPDQVENEIACWHLICRKYAVAPDIRRLVASQYLRRPFELPPVTRLRVKKQTCDHWYGLLRHEKETVLVLILCAVVMCACYIDFIRIILLKK